MSARPYVALPPERLARLLSLIEAQASAADPASPAWDAVMEARDIMREGVAIERHAWGWAMPGEEGE